MIYLKLILTLLLLTSVACTGDLRTKNQEQVESSNTRGFSMLMSGLKGMQGQHYEGWLITPDGPVSSGRFNIVGEKVIEVDRTGAKVGVIGKMLDDTFTMTNQNIANYRDVSAFILTIEPDNDPSDAPSSVHYVGADMKNNVASSTVDFQLAIGTGFAQASGDFMLATPTNGPSTHNQGIWYVNPANGSAALNLPQLNSGWAYEGWIVNKVTGEAISTGIFMTANEEDSDGAGAAAGSNPSPPLPGQDYINPSMVLNDGNHVAVITVEPYPDFDPRPFELKILKSEISNDAPVTTLMPMKNIALEHDVKMTVYLN